LSLAHKTSMEFLEFFTFMFGKLFAKKQILTCFYVKYNNQNPKLISK